MDKKFNSDKRPLSSRLGSAFGDSHAGDGSFTADRTIPGDYDSLPELTEHDRAPAQVHEYAGLSELTDLIDSTLDGPPLPGGDTLDHEMGDFTQTELRAISEDTDTQGQRGDAALHGLLLDCVGVIDDLERVIGSTRESAGDSPPAAQIAALEAVRDGFLGKLAVYGVKRESCMNAPYDPAMHEIAREQTVAESERRGVIIAVERVGYTRDGHPLRRAHVVVGKQD